MRKISLTLVTLSLAGSLFAQSSSSDASSLSSSFKEYWEKLKASPLKLDLSLTSESLKNDNRVQGLDNVLDILAKYKLSPNDTLRLNPSIEYVKLNNYDPAEKDVNEYYFQYVELMYRRSNILTADKNFVNMSAEVRQTYIPNAEYRNGSAANGWSAARVNFNKNIGKLSLTTLGRFEVYNRTDAKPTTLKTLARGYFITGYNLTDKLSLANTLYWTELTYASATPSKHLTSNYVSTSPEVGYAFSKDVNGTLYTIFKLTQSGDGHTLVDDWNDKAVFGANLTLSVF